MLDRAPEPIAGAPVQLAIVDLMGTLVADDHLVEHAYAAALCEAGVEPGTPEDAAAHATIKAMAGRPTLDVLTAALTDPVRAEESTWAFDDAVLTKVPDLQEIPGAGKALDSLAAEGIILALTTSFSPEVRKVALAQIGWTDRFAMTLSTHGVRRGHPAPDLLLHAVLELRIDSVSQVTIVGDNVADLEAGNRAGAGLVIGVRTGNAPTDELEASPHTHLVDSIADVPNVVHSPRTSGQRRVSDG